MEHTITAATLPLSQIKPNKLNPRREFPAEEIAELAESIKRHGLVQPLAVTKNGKDYELLAGERRYRACKKAKLKEVRVEVHDGLLTQEKVELILIENLQRKDLNAIEEARGFYCLTHDWGYSQQQVAEKIGRDRSLVAQRLGLLKLPEAWRQRVVTGVTPATWARLLVPWADRPNVLEAVLKDVQGMEKHQGDVTHWEFEEAVQTAVWDQSRSMTYRTAGFHGVGPQHDCVFKATKEQEKHLDVQEVPDRYGGRKVKRAFNVELWATLQDEAILKRSANAAATANGKPKAKAKAKQTPAERRRAEAEKQRLFERVLYGWKMDWLRDSIAVRVGDELAGTVGPLSLRLLLFYGCAARQVDYKSRIDARDEEIADLLTELGGEFVKRKQRFGGAVPDVWKMLDALDDNTVDTAAIMLLQHWLRGKAHTGFPDAETEQLAGELGIDLETEWEVLQRDQADRERLEAFWALHTKDQLVTLDKKELHVGLAPSMSKTEMVEPFMLLCMNQGNVPLPSELVKVKKPK